MKETKSEMREFKTGATRENDSTKLDYEGFLSPLALKRYAEYMHEHRKQADGKMRDSDNWQKGIPVDAYMKSLFRHALETWQLHRGHPVYGCIGSLDKTMLTRQETLCAVIFNAMGYLHELEKEELQTADGDAADVMLKEFLEKGGAGNIPDYNTCEWESKNFGGRRCNRSKGPDIDCLSVSCADCIFVIPQAYGQENMESAS